MLDGVQDPGNMGTLMRSAVSFGFSTIVLDHCVDIFNPKVIRSTQGAIFKLNYIYEDILSFMNKHDDITYIATDLKAQKDIEDIELPAGPFALILGNEGNGIRETVSDASDIQVKIHMTNTESLNVAVAGSICMYLLKGN
jgi:TrmH family RNA methyltransferase